VQKPPAPDRRSHSHPIDGLNLLGLANFKYADPSTLTQVKAMVVILLAFSATGSLKCSARCQAWRDDGNWERPESQQRGFINWTSLRNELDRALSRSDFRKPGRQNDFELPEFRDSRSGTHRLHPARVAHLDPCFEVALFSSARAPARMSARA